MAGSYSFASFLADFPSFGSPFSSFFSNAVPATSASGEIVEPPPPASDCVYGTR